MFVAVRLVLQYTRETSVLPTSSHEIRSRSPGLLDGLLYRKMSLNRSKPAFQVKSYTPSPFSS